jgi:hypothetical protein
MNIGIVHVFSTFIYYPKKSNIIKAIKNREEYLPTGVVSKNDMGAFKIVLRSFS